MASSTIMKRVPTTAVSIVLRRSRAHISPSFAIIGGRRPSYTPSTLPSHSHSHHPSPSISYFSSLAEDWDDDGDDDENNYPPPPKPISLLPTKHSRNLPPPVCRPSQLQLEVESIFDAPIGSLIVYTKSNISSEVLSVEEEMANAYYNSDAIVQRVEYLMRGLNARISKDSYVSKCLKQGVMEYDEDFDNVNDNDATVLANNDEDDDIMGKEECFRAMIDLIERMAAEGNTYDELRTRVRSQILDPSSVDKDSSSSSSSSSSDSDSSDSDDNSGELDEQDAGDKSFNKWADEMEVNMGKAGYSNNNMSAGAPNEDAKDTMPTRSQEEYQFGATPGLTTHMHDLVLDSLACLCNEEYNNNNKDSSFAELADLMPEDKGSPPELAKTMLDTVLTRHWMDGGDIGVGNGGTDSPFGNVGEGIGVGSGTGAGSMAKLDLSSRNSDVRTCPTPMTFNAVLRIAANFDNVAYAEAVENAKILGGAGYANKSINTNQLTQEKERLRDVTIDAALSTYSRMYDCQALTLRTFKNSHKLATARSSLKRQAKLLADNRRGKYKDDVISGRNSATYTYLIQTIGNCIPPSLSRGNMAYALYHKGCVEEGIMDEHVIKTMRSIGGYGDDSDIEESSGESPAAPISNGALFDSFMQEGLGYGVAVVLDKGRNLRQDRNYKLRRHVDWDDTY